MPRPHDELIAPDQDNLGLSHYTLKEFYQTFGDDQGYLNKIKILQHFEIPNFSMLSSLFFKAGIHFSILLEFKQGVAKQVYPEHWNRKLHIYDVDLGRHFLPNDIYKVIRGSQSCAEAAAKLYVSPQALTGLWVSLFGASMSLAEVKQLSRCDFVQQLEQYQKQRAAHRVSPSLLVQSDRLSHPPVDITALLKDTGSFSSSDQAAINTIVADLKNLDSAAVGGAQQENTTGSVVALKQELAEQNVHIQNLEQALQSMTEYTQLINHQLALANQQKQMAEQKVGQLEQSLVDLTTQINTLTQRAESAEQRCLLAVQLNEVVLGCLAEQPQPPYLPGGMRAHSTESSAPGPVRSAAAARDARLAYKPY